LEGALRVSQMRPDQKTYLKLLPYEEIRKRIIEAITQQKLRYETIPVDRAMGRVCAEVVKSKTDLPSRHEAAMDGYAINSAETHRASNSKPASFGVQGCLHPGSGSRSPLRTGFAFYTATGAPMPTGADTVVKVEETRLKAGKISITHPVERWKNVFRRGEDFHKGQILSQKGRVFNSADVALLISSGRRTITVYKTPRVGILSIGDELTSFDSKERNNKTINNYSNLVSGYLSEFGVSASSIGISKDSEEDITRSIQHAIDGFDILLTIGGSSVGIRDLTMDAVSSLKDSAVIFHGIRMLPIRPTGFVMVGKKPIIILPANAISVALAFFLVVIPILNLLSGLPFEHRCPKITASNVNEFTNDRPISALFLVTIEEKDGMYHAKSLDWGSNSILNLSKANAFVELAPNQKVAKGDKVVAKLLGAGEMRRICIK
jgi:molybdopterin molybdotransferase